MNIPEEKFWSMTPRKFFALVEQHNRFEGGGKEEEKEPETSILIIWKQGYKHPKKFRNSEKIQLQWEELTNERTNCSCEFFFLQ